ncbi:MAG: D-glycerate dehydrogenase [Armatimonadetes bacterium]|nr:D-glycerate dehydrogenase [Armatimonadota bacterium]
MKVLVTRDIPEQALEIVAKNAEMEVWREARPIPRETLLERVVDKIGLLCMLTDRIDDAVLEQGKNLRVVSQMAVGYDNIDVAACTRHGVPVGNTPGVLTETTADTAFALLLATARRMCESEQFLRAGEWKMWDPMLLLGQDVHHATIGIIGMGRIGYEMARRAYGFQMRILYTGRRPNEEAEQHFEAERVDMATLLKASDFISIHTPLNPQTRHLFGAEQFAQMKPTAMLVNTARGAVVDQKALYTALKEGVIGGAGLDVFEQEPLPMDDPLLTLPNVVLVPHIGSASIATRTRMAVLAAENLVAGIQGKPLLHQVSPA